MALSQLPSELLAIIIESLHIPSLYSLCLVNKKCHAVASRTLYKNAARWDREKCGWPMSLLLAAISGHQHAFETLLQQTEPAFVAACNIRLQDNSPAGDKWVEYAGENWFVYHPWQETSLLHLLAGTDRAEMVRLVLSHCTVYHGSPAGYPRIENGLHDMPGNTPLRYAVAEGRMMTAMVLLEAGAGASERNADESMSVLDVAISERQQEMVKLLVQEGADTFAAHPGDPRVATYVLAGETGEPVYIDLLLAAKQRSYEERQWAFGDALGSVVSRSEHTAMAQHLIRYGAIIRDTHLRDAAWSAGMEMLQLLLKAGARFTLGSDTAPNTVLHNGSCSAEMTRFILEQEPALLNLLTVPDGQTPLDTVYPPRRWTRDDDKRALVLIEKGGIVTSSETLCRAASKAHENVVRALLPLDSQKPLISTPDRWGHTALQNAAGRTSHGAQNIVSLLVDAGADPETSQHPDGNTALSIAVRSGAARSVRALLRGGADIHVTNARGENLISRAIKGGSSEVVQVLVEQGAEIHNFTRAPYTTLHAAVDIGVRVDRTATFADMAPAVLLGGGRDILDPNREWAENQQQAAEYLKILGCLLQAGADVSATDPAGLTALDHLILHRLRKKKFGPIERFDGMNLEAVGKNKRSQEAFEQCIAVSQAEEDEDELIGLVECFVCE